MTERIELTEKNFEKTTNHMMEEKGGPDISHKALIIDVGDITDEQRDDLMRQILGDYERSKLLKDKLDKIKKLDVVLLGYDGFFREFNLIISD